ncbi:MAG: Epi-isozizaene 5-monooxygenase/(E)-beta-farnesene synthase [Candidatus Accumulibacter appositus]|uniref:Epi-isozizaene 5-monooxygenase/(E)-beta-farnesene synthase n=1 Tax=Candidatus Accumulibacter appositus TaxID=1454003 RepID=A0A011PXR9_9PROT|nr:cytochrome P450 [Accumulibacter sp.]EXI81797.1 MAG: Epi-isozizaene 5-monooxygenase/(E)-beta-farnesene synthase [Candidatus Accumulibacter appositus]
MGLMLSLAGRLAGRSAVLTRLAGRLVAHELRHLKGKPVERQLLVYELPETQLALANDLRVVDTLLSDRAGTFPKAAALERLLRPLVGGGVFGQPGGDAVKQARRVFLRALARVPEQRVTGVARELTRTYLADWQRRGQPVAIPSELSRLTIDIVSEATLGGRFTAAEGQRFVELFFAYHQRANPVLLLLGGQAPAVQQALVEGMGLAAIGAEMRALIRQRFLLPLLEERPSAEGAPFAAALLEAAAVGLGAECSLAKDEARQTAMLDEIAVMLLAGHETTASVLSWLLWELADAPQEQDAAARVIAAASGGEELQADADIDRQQAAAGADKAVARQLGALTHEALRLYPPIAFLLRETTEAVSFRERPICAGGFVVVSPWTIQRHRALWPEPDRFDPGRWLASEPPAASAERLAMIPFGYGPRVCPGKRFAELEMQAILSELLGSRQLARSRGRAPNPLGTLTSRPDYDFRLQITPRGVG